MAQKRVWCKQTWCSPWLRPIDGMAARLRADVGNQAGSLGHNRQTLTVSISADLKRSLAYSKA